MRFCLIAIGVVLNIILVGSPLMILGRIELLFDPVIGGFVLLTCWFCMTEIAGSFMAGSDVGSKTNSSVRFRDAVSTWLAWITGILVLLTFWTCTLTCATIPLSPTTLLVGALLVGVGGSLRWFAFRTLGSSFVSEVEVRVGQPLIRRGIYRWVRHPSESGLLLATLGAGVFTASLPAIAIWLIAILPLVIYRVHREDRCLRNGFGVEFERYSRDVRRLLPFVY